ncbi:glycosyltransferase [Rhodoflexus sp.]
MYENSPKVSVICLCYNQAAYVQEAIRSVIAQTHRPIELIIADDGSSDGSVQTIRSLLPEIPSDISLKTIFLSQNLGNCKAFNHAFRMATGTYVIDLAADDLLLPDRIAQQVAAFTAAPPETGVVFSDAWIADTQARPQRTFYRRDTAGNLREAVPSGNIYTELLYRHCICAPTMMIRKAVLDELGGYDESLSYEDYDFWVQTARRWHYLFIDQITTIKREIPQSHGKKMYRKGFSIHRQSTLKVCQKAKALNQTAAENAALARMVRYQMRLCLRYRDWINLQGFYSLLQQITTITATDRLTVLPLLFSRLFRFFYA